MLAILLSQLASTLEVVVVVVSIEDLLFVQNIFEMEKFLSEITFNMYQDSSLLSPVVAGRGDILVAGNPSKEEDTWKGKCEAMEKKCFIFHKELAKLQEKAKLT